MIKYLYIAVAILISLMGMEIFLLKKENTKLHENEGMYKAELRELAGTIQQKDKDIELCNKRTEQLKLEGDKRAADAEKAKDQARKAGEKNRQLADQILSFQKKENEDTCQAAKRLFDEYIDMVK